MEIGGSVQLDVGATGTTDIFTTPNNRGSFHVYDTCIRIVSKSGTQTGNPTLGIGTNSPNYDNMYNNNVTIPEGGAVDNFYIMDTAALIVVPASTDIKAKVTTAGGGSFVVNLF